MARNVDNIRVFHDGDVYVTAAGAEPPTAPTTATETPAVGYNLVGWIGEDGVTESREIDSDQKRAWQNSAVVRTVRTSDTRRFQFTALETNLITMGLLRPGATSATASGTTTTNVKAYTAQDKRSWIFDFKDGDIVYRVLIPNGEVVDRGDVQRQAGEIVAYDMTVEAYPTSDGTLYIELTNDEALEVA